ncbi:hypothetical protein I5I61_13685 [Pseudomonas nitroreducens]|uniref:Uncharacterized protein n=1 Tax=Pseudomonas nitroreducens TaxID=46680 RepID=A0ABS0KKL1_PSENT|nr:hypothetical protein [Pseudomonas nitroreducens]MBG6288498.1 hypothetical protein [Pseudomonas nitroreducens]
MKKLLAGLFLAISAFPAAFAVGVVVMQHTYDGGLPTALNAAAKTIGAILGLAVFVFCSGLASRVDYSKSAADAE